MQRRNRKLPLLSGILIGTLGILGSVVFGTAEKIVG